MRQYPETWRIWHIRGVSRTGRPAEIRVRADSHAEALRIAVTRHHLQVATCDLIHGKV